MSVPPPLPSPPCPNCGLPWPADAAVCPNCGYIRHAVSPEPPSARGLPRTLLAKMIKNTLIVKLITGTAAGDIASGISAGLVVFFAPMVIFFSIGHLFFLGLGPMLGLVLYFVLRRRFPIFTRGWGFGWLIGMAVFLGIFAICAAFQYQIDSHH